MQNVDKSRSLSPLTGSRIKVEAGSTRFILSQKRVNQVLETQKIEEVNSLILNLLYYPNLMTQ